MRIGGFIPTTMLDYPKKLACTVFVQGCNLRCPFCQNSSLVLPDFFEEIMSDDEILRKIEKRKNILEGVCISGGEPCLQADLEEFILRIKAMGLPVKLDTNGSQPVRLEKMLKENLLDYVAMDVKASPARYALVCGVDEDSNDFLAPYLESIHALLRSDIEYEFRTTLVCGLHEPSEIEDIAKLLAGAKAWYLQSYMENERILARLSKNEQKSFSAFSELKLSDFLATARKYVPNAQLRTA